MGIKMSISDFNYILSELNNYYQVWAPVGLPGRGAFQGDDLISYGQINKFEDIVFDQKTAFSPKEIVFPPVETMFYFTEDEIREPEIDDKGILIFARACDINAFKRLDTIFLENGPSYDPYYEKRREKVKFVLMECDRGFNNCFCVSMGTNKTEEFSALARAEDEGVKCLVNDSELEPFFRKKGESTDIEPRFVQKNKVSLRIPDKFSENIYKHPIWEEYGARCAACGRCNNSTSSAGCGRCTLHCPTCSCFTIQDIYYRDNPSCGERRRVWASCMIEGFSEMTGSVSVRNTQAERMRFKVLHKIHDFEKRFGFQMCVGCGRCDDICPEYISFINLVDRLYQLEAGGEK